MLRLLNRPTAASFRHAIFAAALVSSAPYALAQAGAGPFSGLSGYWSGSGTITMSNGVSERLRCKATYAVNETGKALNQTLRCASDSYKLEISSNVIFNNGSLSGTWDEATRHASGALTGRGSNSMIQARVDGAGFSAGLEVRFHGDNQSVSIRPTAGTDVANVAITMRKS